MAVRMPLNLAIGVIADTSPIGTPRDPASPDDPDPADPIMHHLLQEQLTENDIRYHRRN